MLFSVQLSLLFPRKAKKKFKVTFFLIFYALFYLPVAGCFSIGNVPNRDSEIEQKTDNLLLVERVIDGDTFVISGEERVRLIGVDAPEARAGTSPEPYGKEASAFTREMLEGMQVELLFDVQEQDQYGRLLAYVYLEDGIFFNELLVREGYAMVYTVPPNVAQVETLLAAQQYAMENQLGLWGLAEVLDELDKLWLDESGQGLIKGNISRERDKIYHLPGGQYYEQTKAELWFKTEREAIENGFRNSRR